MEAKVTFCGGMRFVGEADSGHAVVMDTGEAGGGRDSAVRPNELLLIGLAGCTGMDVISILRKKRQAVTGLELIVRGDLTPEPPKRFTGLAVEYRVRGRGLDPAAVAARDRALRDQVLFGRPDAARAGADHEHLHDPPAGGGRGDISPVPRGRGGAGRPLRQVFRQPAPAVSTGAG